MNHGLRRSAHDGELTTLRQALHEALSEIDALRMAVRVRDAQLATLQAEVVTPVAAQALAARGGEVATSLAAACSKEPAAAPSRAASGSLSRIAVLEAEASAASAAAERRSSERWGCALEVEFSDESQFFAGLSQDISMGGLFLATYRKLAVGTSLRLRFDLPDGTTIEAGGEVRWVCDPAPGRGRPGVGVAFTDLAPAALEQIRAFCEVTPPLYVEL
jgi:uncharacterized protein (TIGR02266 family)